MDAKQRNDITDWLTDMISMAEASRQYREGYAWATVAVVRARKTRATLERALAEEISALSFSEAFSKTS